MLEEHNFQGRLLNIEAKGDNSSLSKIQKDQLTKTMNDEFKRLSAEISYRVARAIRETQYGPKENDTTKLNDQITVTMDSGGLNRYTVQATISTLGNNRSLCDKKLVYSAPNNTKPDDELKNAIKRIYLSLQNQDTHQLVYSEQDINSITIGDKPASPTGCWSAFIQACMWAGLILEAAYFAFTLENLSHSLLGEDIIFPSSKEQGGDNIPGILPGLDIISLPATTAWRTSVMLFATGLALLDLAANLDVITPKKSTQQVFDVWSSAKRMRIPLAFNMISYVYGGFGDFDGINNFTKLARGINTDAWHYALFPLFQLVSLCAAASYYSGFHAEKINWLMDFFAKEGRKKFWDFGAKLSKDARGPATLHSLSLLCYVLKDLAILGMIRCISFAYLGQTQMNMIHETYGVDQSSAIFISAATALRWMGGLSTVSQVLTVYSKGIIKSLYIQEEESELKNLGAFNNFKEYRLYKNIGSSKIKQGITGLSTWLGFPILANFLFMDGAEALWENPGSSSAMGLYIFSAVIAVPVTYWAAKWKEHENEVAVFTKIQSIQENKEKLQLYFDQSIDYTDILCEIRGTAKTTNDPEEKTIRIHRESLKTVRKSMQELIVQWQQLKTIVSNPEDENLLGQLIVDQLNHLEKSYTERTSTRKISFCNKHLIPGPFSKALGTTLARQLVLFHFVASVMTTIDFFSDRSYVDNFVLTLALVAHNIMGTFFMFYEPLSTGEQCVEEDFNDTYQIIDNLKKDEQLNCLESIFAKCSLWWRKPSVCFSRRNAQNGDTLPGESVLPRRQQEAIPLTVSS